MTQQRTSARANRSRGLLADMVRRDEVYQDVLNYVLTSGGPGLGFDEAPTDPMADENIAGTLYRTADKLLRDSTIIVLPPISSLVTSFLHTPARQSVAASGVKAWVSAESPRLSATDEGDSDQAPCQRAGGVDTVPYTQDSMERATAAFTPEQREHYDEAVYFVTLATCRKAIDGVIEESEYRTMKRTILDALLYGLSVLCRYGFSETLEDEHGRPILEVVVHGMVNLLVNMNLLMDLQFLNALRGCRVCDLIRWCHVTAARRTTLTSVIPSKRTVVMLDLAAGLSLALLLVCFPRLPTEVALSILSIKQALDSVRRTYCGYDDCEAVVADIASIRSNRENFAALRDSAFILEEVRRYYDVQHQIERDRSVSRSPDQIQRSPHRQQEKLHPWMVAGSVRELHYIATVPLRSLEAWLGISCDQEWSFFDAEKKGRRLIADAAAEALQQFGFTAADEMRQLQRKAIQHKQLLQLYDAEVDARRQIEQLYDQRTANIREDLRRFHHYLSQYIRTESGMFAEYKPFAMPTRLYFLEVAEIHTLEVLELSHRNEIVRNERYAFAAFRESWDMDFQWVVQLMAEEEREKASRAAYLASLMAAAEQELALTRPVSRFAPCVSPPPDDRRASHRSTAPTSTMAPSPPPQSREAVSPLQPRACDSRSVPEGPESALPSNTMWSRQPTSSGYYASAFSPPPQTTHPALSLLPSATSRPASVMSGPDPPMPSWYQYYNPHSTAPSSLGFQSGTSNAAVPDVLAHLRRGNPAPMVPEVAYASSNSKPIVLTARVISPEPVSTATAAATNQAVLELLLRRFQDLSDDEDIERALLEDTEVNARKEIQRLYYEGRSAFRVDWSMTGYRRLVSSLGHQMMGPGSSLSLRGGSRFTTTSAMASGFSSPTPQHTLPESMRLPGPSRSSSRAASRAAAATSPPPAAATSRAVLTPFNTMSGGPLPGSSLMQSVLFQPAPPAAKFGHGGAATPSAQFLPKGNPSTFQRQWRT